MDIREVKENVINKDELLTLCECDPAPLLQSKLEGGKQIKAPHVT